MRHRFPLVLLALAAGAAASPADEPVAPGPDPVVRVQSPGRRFVVEFSRPRSTPSGADAGPWAVITIRDLSRGTGRTAHVATGERGTDATWEAYRPLEGDGAWSPDGLYVAYLRCGCRDQPGLPGFDSVCHDEISFLPMLPPPPGRRELALGVLAFSGWEAGRRHTVREIDLALSDGTSHLRLPYETPRAGSR